MSRRLSLPFVRRPVAWGLVALAAACAALWVATLIVSVGDLRLGGGLSLSCRDGVVNVPHLYDRGFASGVSARGWQQTWAANGWVPPNHPPVGLPWFHYSAGHVVGEWDGTLLRPARYRLVRVPLWVVMLPGVIVASLWVARWRRERRGAGRGFPVEPAAAETGRRHGE